MNKLVALLNSTFMWKMLPRDTFFWMSGGFTKLPFNVEVPVAVLLPSKSVFLWKKLGFAKVVLARLRRRDWRARMNAYDVWSQVLLDFQFAGILFHRPVMQLTEADEYMFLVRRICLGSEYDTKMRHSSLLIYRYKSDWIRRAVKWWWEWLRSNSLNTLTSSEHMFLGMDVHKTTKAVSVLFYCTENIEDGRRICANMTSDILRIPRPGRNIE